MNPLDDLFAALCEIGPLTGNDERDKKRTRAKEVIMRWCIATADTYGQVERRVSWRAAVPDVIDELVRQARNVALDRARKEIEQLTIRLGDRFSSVKLYFADLCARRDRLLVRSGP